MKHVTLEAVHTHTHTHTGILTLNNKQGLGVALLVVSQNNWGTFCFVKKYEKLE